jgi:hypothetical protein
MKPMPEEKQPEEKQSEKKRHAVIVGINDYPNIPKLTGAVSDATDLSELFKKFGGFEIDHFLTDKNATCGAIRKAISDLFWQLNPCDIALFYFSGHGFADTRGNGYIAPYDMLNDEPLVYGINMRELKQIFWNSKNKTSAIMIFDCCYSGIITKGDKSIPDAKASFEPDFEDLESGEGKIILASSGGDQTSKETSDCKHVKKGGSPHPHGTFTFHLIEGLYGDASDTETGIITLGQLWNYVTEKMTDPKPISYGEEVASMNDIDIAKDPGVYKKYREDILEDVKDLVGNRDNPTRLIVAVGKISKLMIYTTDQGSLKVKQTVIDAINEYKNPFDKWYLEHQVKICNDLRYGYLEIERLAGYLSFEKIEEIITLGQTDQALLANLCRVCKGQLEYDKIIEQFKPFDNPPISHNKIKVGRRSR